MHRTDDVRIREIKELVPPAHVLREFPVSEKAALLIYETRQAVHRIWKEAKLGVTEIGRMFNRTPSAISQLIRAMETAPKPQEISH